jgi:predicted phage tail protein
MANIQGRKGGGSNAQSPKESPDSLHSVATAKILLALSEGECAGGLTDKDIYLDGTPVRAQDGTLNFPGVTWEYRPGTQAQEYIQGIPSVENEITVNTPLKQTQPWTRAISNIQLSAIRIRLGLPTLQKQKDNGDVVGSRVEYKIELATDGGAYQIVVNGAFDGKTTSLYERSHRIDLPVATTGWQVRVSRITADSVSNRLADATNIEAYSEVIDAKLRYPNTELLFVTFDAKQFSNIPQISVKAPGRLIRVPTTYDPVARTYSGTWDGSFKWAYSNNPAWVFYDIVLNPRFGLGDRLDTTQVDKWELYRIAQYCDQLVPDGLGGSGTEPRFLCDVFIQSQNEAFNVLRDLASIFRGMTYWANNQLVALADQPRDMTYVYTRANVIDGKFVYAGGSERNRYSTAMVSWSNPDNHYTDEVEAVVEQDLVRRYRVRQTEITAIGCTRRTEANRRGRWVLLSNAKDRLVTFSTGLEGMLPLPGHIIGVADQNLSGKVMGGRISAVSGRMITLDRVAEAKPGDRLMVNLPSGISQARTIQAVTDKVITVTTAYSETPESEAVWSVDADDLFVQQYRVTSVTDNDDGTFTITAINHNPDKYAAIDSGARLDERPISAIPPGVQAPPASVTIDSYSRVVQSLSVQTMRVTWPAVPNAIAYECEWRKDNGDWVNAPRTLSPGFEVSGIYSGRYAARVRAINSSDISSIWTVSQEVELTGKTGSPSKPVGLTATTDIIFGVNITWGFPADTGDTLNTELQYSTTFNGGNPVLLADVPYPQKLYQQMGLNPGTVFWYRARLVDRIGNQSDWTAWVSGHASDDVSGIIDFIDKGVKETDTYKALEKGITDVNGRVDGVVGDVATVAQSVMDEVKNRGDAITAEATQIRTEIGAVAQKAAEELAKEVTTRGTAITSQNSEIATLKNSVAQQIASVAAGAGEQFDALSIWYFDQDAQGWTGADGQPVAVAGGWMRAHDTELVSPAIDVDAATYRYIKLRMKKNGAIPAGAALFTLSWTDDGVTWSSDMVLGTPTYDTLGVSTFDVADIPWTGHVHIIRLKSSVAPTATDYLEFDWIAIGRPTPGVSWAAMNQATTALQNQISSEVSDRETLATQLRGNATGAGAADLDNLKSGLLFQERKVRSEADTQIASSVTQLRSDWDASNATITQKLETLTGNDTAHASALQSLNTDMGDAKASVESLQEAVLSNATAVSRTFLTHRSELAGNKASVTQLAQTMASENEVMAQQITTVQADLNGKASTTALTVLQTKVTEQEGEINANSSAITKINQTLPGKAETSAVTTLQTQITDHDGRITANTNAITAVSTKVDTAVADAVSSLQTTITQQDGRITANSQALTNVTATANGASAAVQVNAQSIASMNGKLSAQWGVKVSTNPDGGNPRIGGIQLGIDATGSSQFLVQADTFAVYNPVDGSNHGAFYAEGGRVYMNGAFIKDASITNAMIGDHIQSSNYDWNNGDFKGWYIGKDGTALLSNVTVKGTVHATGGEFDGTVYARHIVGDIITSTLLPRQDYSNRQSGHDGDVFQSVVYYRGGSEYPMYVSIPYATMFVDYVRNGIMINSIKIEVLINGIVVSSLTYAKPVQGTAISISGSGVIPAGAANVPIAVRCTFMGPPDYVDLHIQPSAVFVNFLAQGDRFYT